MEIPSKRRRVSSYKDSNLEIHELRARNDLKLKSTFESIFEKYSQDFHGVGDEIDLETGEIVVNNGHLRGMRDEIDVGYDIDDTEADELANDLLSDVGQEDLSVDYMEKSLNLRYEEQEQHTTIASPEAPHSIMEDVDSLMGDIQDDDLLPSKKNITRAVIDQQFNSELGILRRAPGSIGAHAHLLPPNITSSGSPRSNGHRVVSQSCISNTDPYDSVVEPAWRAPPLPITSLGSGTRAVSASLPFKEDIRRQRPLSPARRSLWAPEKTPGWRRKDSRRISSPKLTSNVSASVARPPRRELEPAPEWLSTPSRRKENIFPTPVRAYSANTKRRRHKSSPVTRALFSNDNSSKTQGDGLLSAEEENLLLRLKAPTEPDFQESENHLPGRTWHSIKHHWYAIESRTKLWTEAEDQLLWHLKTNTKLFEWEIVPYLSGKTQRQIRYRWSCLKDFTRSKETFKAMLPGAATVQDDQWLQELVANSLLPPGQNEEQSPAKPAQNLLQHDENSLPCGEVDGDSATDKPQRDLTTAAGSDTELNLDFNAVYDAVDIKEEPLERPSFTQIEKSAARKSIENPSPVVVQQNSHHSGAGAVVPRFSPPIQPKPNSIQRFSKHKRRDWQSKNSNARTHGAKFRPRATPSTPSRSQRHPTKSTKLTPTISLTSMMGCDSEDELCRPEKTVGTSEIGPVTTPLSTARKCGTLGFKCTKSLCLRCA